MAGGDEHAPDTARVIMHVDVDAFYCQVEELNDPSLRGRPMAVTQKYLVVTCNYPARARGVTKLMAIRAAKEKCPELTLVNGEDLTPYRSKSKAVRMALAGFGPVQKLGLDECVVDITRRAREDLAAEDGPGSVRRAQDQIGAQWVGHVHRASTGTIAAEAEAGSGTVHRPMDLRATTSDANRRSSEPRTSVDDARSGAAHGECARLAHHPGGTRDVRPSAESSEALARAAPVDPTPARDDEAAAEVEAVEDEGKKAGEAGTRLLMRGTAIAAEARARARALTGLRCSAGVAHNRLLMGGTAIAAEARARVLALTGLRCSAGVAHNRLLAKLASGLHKPDAQTALPATEAAAFVAPLPVRALPGVGFRAEALLTAELGVRFVADLRAHSASTLARALASGTRAGGNSGGAAGSGAAQGRPGVGGAAASARELLEMAFGRDASPVVATEGPKSVSVEDSFKCCDSHEALSEVVATLAPDLVLRLREEESETGRRARTLVCKWRAMGRGTSRVSRSVPMPAAAYAAIGPRALGSPSRAVHAVEAAVHAVLRAHLHPPFTITLLNVGATSFEKFGTATAAHHGASAAWGRVADVERVGTCEQQLASRFASQAAASPGRASALLAEGGGCSRPILSKAAQRAHREGQDLAGAPAQGMGLAGTSAHPVSFPSVLRPSIPSAAVVRALDVAQLRRLTRRPPASGAGARVTADEDGSSSGADERFWVDLKEAARGERNLSRESREAGRDQAAAGAIAVGSCACATWTGPPPTSHSTSVMGGRTARGDGKATAGQAEVPSSVGRHPSPDQWGSWVCAACTLINPKPHAPVCEVCQAPRTPQASEGSSFNRAHVGTPKRDASVGPPSGKRPRRTAGIQGVAPRPGIRINSPSRTRSQPEGQPGGGGARRTIEQFLTRLM